uniref:Carbamoyltransferase domain-containing protein n=1 Tax=Eutreptiella gymnastica TaxID=73025 RepID=A0A7S4GAA8_9EUGL
MIMNYKNKALRQRVPLMKALVPHDKSMFVHHHEAHALYGFYDSPFHNALVLTMDGGGDDGHFWFWRGDRHRCRVKRIQRVEENWGRLFFWIAQIVHEDLGLPHVSNWTHWASMTNPGLLMEFASYGQPQADWVEPIREFAHNATMRGSTSKERLESLCDLKDSFIRDQHTAADFVATAQLAMETAVRGHVTRASTQHPAAMQGIVLSGGVAFNTKLHRALFEAFKVPVHAPAGSADDGQTVGMVYSQLPSCHRQEVVESSLRFIDAADLPQYVQQWNGRAVDAEATAALLAEGKVIGVLRGRFPLGLEPHPSALRSIVAHVSAAQRFNATVMHRWYQPMHILAALQDVGDLVQEPLASEMFRNEVQLRTDLQRRFPAIVDQSGRARLHPIGNGTDPWLPRVLQRLGALTGVPLLLHAMYDSLAAPQNIALNNISQALRLWQSEQRLDYVVVEDFMFGPRAAV